MVRREGKRVRLFTRRGRNWTHRFGELPEAISSIRGVTSLTIDGEACVCGSDGVPVFALLHSGSYDSAVVLYAFDLLELNGRDLRTEPLERRKAKLAKLLEKADPSRLGYTDHAEEDGADISVTPAGSAMKAFQQAAGFWLPLRPLQGLGKGEEPEQSCDDAN